jgi:hypothetical protein
VRKTLALSGSQERSRWLFLLASALLALAPLAALAQSNSGIAGVVKDTTGAVLPGVTVEAASPALIEKVRSVVTDSAGQYKIVNLVPGVYSVTFTLPGFNTSKRDGIELTASFTANVNAEMRLGALEETITVTGETPTVDVQNVVTQRVVTRDVIDAIPTGSKSVAHLGVLIPGVTVNNQDVGGSAFTSSQIAIHGGRAGEQQLLYDGMMYNNGQGRGGQYTAIATNDGTVQEVSLETGGLGAESEMSGIRTNVIPKEGGNTFRGTFSAAFTNHELQSSNLTDEFKAQGLLTVSTVHKIYDVNPGFGGPLVKDRLWFYTSVRAWSAQQYVAGMFFNKSTVPWMYVADTTRPALNIETNGNESLRVTWQASAKHKLNGQYQYGQQDRPYYGYSLGQTLASPEAAYASKSIPSYLGQVGWNAPLTNKVLLEAGAAVANKNFFTFLQPIAGNNPSYQESATGNFWGNSRSTYGQNANWQMNTRASMSYVTGSHAAKFGFTFQHQESRTTQDISYNGTLLTLLNGAPRSVTVWATPLLLKEINKANVGIFAQDQWTMRNLTLNLGIRYDYFNSYVPPHHLGPGPHVPTRNVDFEPVYNVPNWKDTSPRLGASYDLFGNGKTAVKFTAGRYLEAPLLISFTRVANPAGAISTNATRTWADLNGDYLPQEIELGALSNANFGKSIITTRYDDEVPETRGYNWEISSSLQHELMPRVAANVGYFRRWYGNTRLTDNLLVSPADYSPYCVTAPVDARLPDGGGYQVCGLYNISPAKFGQVDNLMRLSEHYGDDKEIYNGVDASVSARLPRGIVVQGGTSTGRTMTEQCYVVDSPEALRFCKVTPPFFTQVKLVAVYPLPWGGIQTSAAFQSLPGPMIAANRVYTNAEVLPSLGRNLAAGANGTVTVNLIEPGTMYNERLNQLDFRLSKIFRLGGARRLQANMDLFNMFNASAVLGQNNTYGPSWLRPTNIIQGRLVKFGGQLDF